MSNKIQLKRGLKSRLTTLSAGEPAFTTDTRELFLGTGSGNINMSGSTWYTGTAMSGTSTASGAYSYSSCPQVKTGDIYLNTTYGYYYQCTTAGSGTSAKWTYKGTLKGDSGTVTLGHVNTGNKQLACTGADVANRFAAAEKDYVTLICTMLSGAATETKNKMKTVFKDKYLYEDVYRENASILSISDFNEYESGTSTTGLPDSKVLYISTQLIEDYNVNDIYDCFDDGIGHTWNVYDYYTKSSSFLTDGDYLILFDKPLSSGTGKCYILQSW